MNVYEQLLAEKTILITGASRGVGRAIALDLARQGAHLLLTATSLPGLQAVANEIEQQGADRPHLQPAGPICEADLKQLARTVRETWGHLDILK